MSVTLTIPLFAEIDDADATTNWQLTGGISMVSLNTASEVEGTGCIEGRVNSGVGTVMYNHGVSTGADQEDNHLYAWFKLAQSINTFVNGGARLRISDDTDGNGNYGEWNVYGSNVQVVVYNGWMMLVVDVRRPFDVISGTPPPLTSIETTGTRVDFLSGNGKDLAVADLIKFGTALDIAGGTSTTRGTWAEVAVADESAGLGLVRPVAGVYYANVGIDLGDLVAATTFFEDKNQILIFEDLPVSGSHYKIKHDANLTGTNHVRFGESSGSGVDKEGTSGMTFKATGAAPFRIEVINGNMDVADYFGCTLLGPPVIYPDALRTVKERDSAVFTDITRNANGGLGTTDQRALPVTQALFDAIEFGHNERFYGLNINLTTAKGGTWTGQWEYFNGTVFAALDDVSDGTDNFTVTGPRHVDWSIPDDWTKSIIDGDNRYWVRFNIDSFTSSGTAPVIESNAGILTVDMAGDVRLENSVVEMIGCTLTQMGAVRIRLGADFKKCSIIDSIVPGKYAALDLGSADPSADTVRDLIIQGCEKGVLLKGTVDTTYNFRNIEFIDNDKVFAAFQEDFSPGLPVDMTDQCNSTDTNDIEFYPVTPGAADIFWVGKTAPFGEMSVNVGQAGAGTYTNTLTYEKEDGTIGNLASVTDGTNNFKTAGTNTISWTIPSDWAATVEAGIGAVKAFYVRIIRDGGTETTRPLGTQIKVPKGDVRVEFDSGDTVTITLLEDSTVITEAANIDNVNGSTIVILRPKVVRLTVNDNVGDPLQNARVILEAKDGAGALPFQDTVTITNVTTTASVSHTAHGMRDGDKVVIRGANENPYNGAFAITNVAVNSYDYTMDSDPGGNATGTITATGAVFEGLTNASGIIENLTFNYQGDQNVIGFARKSTSSPRFKSATLDATIEDTGLIAIIRMVLDE